MMDDSTPLIEVDLTVWAFNRLAAAGYTTVGAVRAASDTKLLDIRRFGEACLREVRAKLGPHRATTPQGAKQ